MFILLSYAYTQYDENVFSNISLEYFKKGENRKRSILNS